MTPMKPFTPHDPAALDDSDERLSVSRRECPVNRVSDVLFVLAAERDVRDAFEDTRHFSNKGNFTIDEADQDVPFPAVTLTDPPLHTELRARLMRSMAPGKLRAQAPEVENVVAKVLETLPLQGEIDLYEQFIRHIPAAVAYSIIGLPRDLWDRVQYLTDAVVAGVPAATHNMPENQELLTILGRVVSERRARRDQRRPDVLDNLCFAQLGERQMTDPEVVGQLRQLFAAATDTTRSLLANLIFRLLEHRRWEIVASDRRLLPNAVEESLRYDAPAVFMSRRVIEDVETGGCPVTAGHKVYLSIQSANRDEAAWGRDAHQFQIKRSGASQHLAFGRGIHACVGAPLARLETISAANALMNRFPGMTLSENAKWVKVEGQLLRRPKEVLVLLDGDGSQSAVRSESQ